MQRLRKRTLEDSSVLEPSIGHTIIDMSPEGEVPSALTPLDIARARTTDSIAQPWAEYAQHRASSPAGPSFPRPSVPHRMATPSLCEAPPSYSEAWTFTHRMAEPSTSDSLARASASSEKRSLASEKPAWSASSASDMGSRRPFLLTSPAMTRLSELSTRDAEAACDSEANRLRAQLRFDLFQLDTHHWERNEDYIRLTSFLRNWKFQPGNSRNAPACLHVCSHPNSQPGREGPSIYLVETGFLASVSPLGSSGDVALAPPRIIAAFPEFIGRFFDNRAGEQPGCSFIKPDFIAQRLASVAQKKPLPIHPNLAIYSSERQASPLRFLWTEEQYSLMSKTDLNLEFYRNLGRESLLLR